MKKRIFLVSTSRFHYRQLANELETDDISVKTVISSSIRYCKAPPFFFAVFTPLFFNVSMLASRLFPRSRLNQFLRFAANKEATLRLKLALLLSRVKPSAVVTLSHIGYVSARNKSFLHIVDVPLAHPYHVSRVLGSAYADLGIDHSAKKIDFVNTYDIEHQSILSADLVTVPSQFVRQTLIDNGVSSGKIVIIPYGLNFSDFKSEQKVAQQNNFSQLNPPLLGHNADGSIFRILFVGGLTVRKGLHVLLEAFDRIDYYNKELVLIGPFSWETSLLLSRYGDKRIRLLGKVPHVS
jgi:glycosyltransferase involved in cell wall biosynthesis